MNNKKNIDQDNLTDKESIFKKYIEFFGILAVLIILMSGYFVLIRPRWNFNNQLTDNLSKITKDINKRNIELERLRFVLDTYDQVIQANKNFVNFFLPNQLDLASLIPNINAIANKNEMDIESIQYYVNNNLIKKCVHIWKNSK